MQKYHTSSASTKTHGSLHDQVAAKLRDLIVSGDLASGSKLSERKLSETYGFPRTPLREAFKVLEAEGLVSRTPNKGAFVSKTGISEIEQIFEVLLALEAQAAKLLAERITDTQIAEIEQAHNRMIEFRRKNRLMDYFNANQDLHQMIIAASGNSFLERAYKSHSARILRFRFMGNQRSERWQEAVIEHEHILRAIKDRDGPLLEAALCSHLKKGWAVVKTLLSAEH